MRRSSHLSRVEGSTADGSAPGPGTPDDSPSTALTLLFLFGGPGAVVWYRTARGGRRVRHWARRHPWRVTALPAALLLTGDVVARQALTRQGFIGSLWDGLWRAVLVAGVMAAAATAARSSGRT